jgi:uncharacterized protein YggE
MKKFAPIIAFCLLLCFGVCFAQNTAYAQPNSVIVVGKGEVKLTPDTATISFGVVSTAPTLEQANQDNTQKIEKIRNTLQQHKIEPNNIQTKNFFAQQEYSYEEKQPVPKGYRISNQIVVKTQNIADLTQIISAVMADGANEFYGVWFESSKTNSAYQTALQNALEDAKQKAHTLSGTSNMNMLEIVEESVWTHHVHKNYVAEASGENQFFEGEIVVRAQVKVLFSNQDQTQAKTQNTTRTRKIERTNNSNNTQNQNANQNANNANPPAAPHQTEHAKQPKTTTPIDVQEPAKSPINQTPSNQSTQEKTETAQQILVDEPAKPNALNEPNIITNNTNQARVFVA